jgi:hypothetical protein
MKAVVNHATIEHSTGLSETAWSWTRRWGRNLLCLSADAYPLRHDLDRDDQDCAWPLIIPLQVDLIARLDVRAIHQLLGHGYLTVISDLTGAVRHVHMTQTTNICNLSARVPLSGGKGAGHEQ